jgi:hypothetical protein
MIKGAVPSPRPSTMLRGRLWLLGARSMQSQSPSDRLGSVATIFHLVRFLLLPSHWLRHAQALMVGVIVYQLPRQHLRHGSLCKYFYAQLCVNLLTFPEPLNAGRVCGRSFNLDQQLVWPIVISLPFRAQNLLGCCLAALTAFLFGSLPVKPLQLL